MSKIHSIIIGSNAPIIVQLYEADNDTGSNGINYEGATGLSAKAKATDGTVIPFTNVTVSDDTNGLFQLDYLITTFTAVETYDIQIQFNDASGKTHIYPSEGNTLKLAVKERIV